MKHTILFSLFVILFAGFCFAQNADSNVNAPADVQPFTVEPVTENVAPNAESNADSSALQQAQAEAQKALTEGDKQVEEKKEQDRLAKEQQDKEAEAKKNQVPQLNIWELVKSGGVLMIPIAFLSVLGLAFALERFVMLRRGAIMPRRLFKKIEPYLQASAFNPQAVWDICVRYPSPAARIIQAMLLKIGRPLPEIEAAANATKQEEATNMYNNVRWITLVSSLAPLLGLLGTVWGMIQAFFITANLEIGGNRAEQLSSGIYVALVTTAAGLVVAIPAAFIAHWYEGKILNAFKKLDSRLLPIFDVLEQQEGRQRITLAEYQMKK